MNSIAAAVAAFLIFAPPAFAQWANNSASSLPRTRDGKPNLSAPAPKAPDGKIDLSGVWLADADPNGKPQGVENQVFPKYFINIAADLKQDAVPFQPSAQALFIQRLQNRGKDAPAAHCKPSGVPNLNSVPLPYKIVQTPRLILILYEENTVFRQIFLDGRQPVKDPEPRWMGYSSGKWEGETLVVDTVGFNDQSWLDGMGHPHTESMHLIERFRRRDTGHLEVEVTIDDPKAYTRPITYTQKTTILPDEDLLEYFCTENEKDLELSK
jgi:hypothetical protein